MHMEEKRKYTTPEVDVVNLMTDYMIFTSADPVFVNPFSGGEEEWD